MRNTIEVARVGPVRMNVDLSVLHLWKICLEPELGDTTTMKKGLVFRGRS